MASAALRIFSLGIALFSAPAVFAATKFEFPMAGSLDRDLFNGNFVDLDPTPARETFSCHDWAADGHRGNDFALRTFEEQFIGVPVFAAADGVVTFVEKGDANDTNTGGSLDPGNRVYIDHGNGVQSEYWHLAHASVPVAVSDPVVAGEQIGLAASSGNSFGPHLHFEVLDGGAVVEPYAGACNPGPGAWVEQIPLVLDPYAIDFGITDNDLTNVAEPWFPDRPATDAQIATGSPIYFWFRGGNLPASPTAHVVIRQPDDSIWVDDSFTLFAPAFERTMQRWIGGYFLGFTTGSWRVTIEIDGTEIVDAPFEIVTTPNPAFNRAPEVITASLLPAPLVAGDVPRCEVTGDVLKDDLDWDLVRYRYRWKVNGSVVRDLVHAGRSDRIPRDSFSAGDSVRCEITPNDGTLDGATASVEVVAVGAAVPALPGAGWLVGAACIAGVGGRLSSRRKAAPGR